MSGHRFKIGQLVEYSPGRLIARASSYQYKIIRLLPIEGGVSQYRIKGITETLERIVKESQLTGQS